MPGNDGRGRTARQDREEVACEPARQPAGDPPRAWGVTWAASGLGAVAVLVLCAATGPSRAMAKLLVIGALLIGGNVIAARAPAGGFGRVRRG